MTKETSIINAFNYALHTSEGCDENVMKLITSYLRTSFRDHNRNDYTHIGDGYVVVYKVTKELWRFTNIKKFKGHKEREVIYAVTNTGDIFRMSSKNLKKYIRHHRHQIGEILLKTKLGDIK